MRKLFFFIMLVQTLLTSGSLVAKAEEWKIKLQGAVFSTPVINGNTIFVGTEEGYFYWIDGSTGEIIHEVKIPGPIRSDALVVRERVFIESLGQLYCFNTATASREYVVSPEEEKVDMIDPWDYFHCSPVENNGTVYFTGNKGIIYAVNPENGVITNSIISPEGVPVRSDLTFFDGSLYFGDNNGVVYGYDFEKESFTLTHRIFKKTPLPTYKYIMGGPFIYKGKLIFSNRHEIFTALNFRTGEIAWSKTDLSGSWWSAVPVFSDNKVIICGSDNLLVEALNINSGETIWSYKADYNMFCAPLITQGTLILGTGDSYLNRKGDGSVFSLDINTGKLVNKFNPGGNVFSSPVKYENNIIICTTTGNMQSISEVFFTKPQSSQINIEGDVNVVFNDDNTSIIEKEIKVNNPGDKAVIINYTIETSGNIPDSLLKLQGLRDCVYPKGTSSIFLQANRGNLEPGMYQGRLTITFSNKTKPVVKPFSIEVKGKANLNTPDFEVTDFSFDSIDFTVKCCLKVNRDCKIIALLSPVENDSIAGVILPEKYGWGIYRKETDIFSYAYKSNIDAGSYHLLFKSKNHRVSFDVTRK